LNRGKPYIHFIPATTGKRNFNPVALAAVLVVLLFQVAEEAERPFDVPGLVD
jgi:hypothetical protein